MDFTLDTVYPPAEDSELLLEVALREVREDDEVLEVGVGSGFVAEKIKEKCQFLLATDINPFACKMAREKGIDVVRTDLVKGIRKKFTLILFNPPYLELDEIERKGDWLEKAIDGGKGGIEVICRFLDLVRDVLDERGRIILIVSSFNVPHVFEKIEKRGFRWKIVAKRYLFFEELYALKIESL
ncbi:methylase [Archaeoglobus profundus DSM 5631]|uniref:Methylase n=2 Tax=Archaeoglobus profundus TaxID=84156 RepID=D2RFS2_ARCPA|nr:methylase [Archaeoglobus profundus DSM 5631]